MSLYGVDLHCQGKQLILDLQTKIKQQGPLCLRRLEYHCERFDANQTSGVLLSELHESMNMCGLFPSVGDLRVLQKNFITADGNFAYVNFLSALRPKLSDRSASMVNTCWDRLTKGDKQLLLSDCRAAYCPESSPAFRAEEQNEEEARDEFATLIGTHARIGGDGCFLDQQAFIDFNRDVRLCLPNDDYFVQMLDITWGQAEATRMPSREEIEGGILRLRSAMIQRSTGLKDEVEVRKFIQTWNRTGFVNKEELYELMLSVGVDGTPVLAEAIIARLDLKKCGQVDLNQLVNAVCSADPRWG